jgi:hypothetical protein
MCSGLRDAANLAWKIDLLLGDIATDDLLETYQSERLPSVKAAIDFSTELGKVICVADPAEAAARDEVMAAGVGEEPAPAPGLPDIGSGFIHPTAPHAGKQFVQGRVGGRLFDEAHGNGWRLVVLDASAEAIGRNGRAWFESIGGRVVRLADPDPLFIGWFAEHGTSYALQRPDFYLYGTAQTEEQATTLLGDLRRQLSGRGTP